MFSVGLDGGARGKAKNFGGAGEVGGARYLWS